MIPPLSIYLIFRHSFLPRAGTGESIAIVSPEGAEGAAMVNPPAAALTFTISPCFKPNAFIVPDSNSLISLGGFPSRKSLYVPSSNSQTWPTYLGSGNKKHQNCAITVSLKQKKNIVIACVIDVLTYRTKKSLNGIVVFYFDAFHPRRGTDANDLYINIMGKIERMCTCF